MEWNKILSRETFRVSGPEAGIRLYAVLLLLLGIYYFGRWPIIAGDTDLWYHLSGGRYLFEHKALPANSFFSFISPSREWVDYYWLFQALVYGIYSWFGYHGLVLLRAAVFLATISIILGYLFKKPAGQASLFYPALIFALFLLFLPPRFQLLRPHIFSYLMIAAFLYILEFRGRKTLLLPVLAVLWSNLHGIEYPIMFFILLAYLLEIFIRRVQEKQRLQKEEIQLILILIVTLNTVYLTPHGSKLLLVPFVSIENASYYINEFRTVTLDGLFSLQTSRLVPTLPTFFNLLFLTACVSAGLSLLRRKMRASHLLLFAGGLFLLTKGSRFFYEFALLALPLLKSQPWHIPLTNLNRRAKWALALAALFVLLLPIAGLWKQFSNRPKFPLSLKNLPQGTVAFLRHVPAGGSVLNHPNHGGYLQWMLYPRYKILMDMEVPFLFKDEDFFMAKNAFQDGEVLRRLLQKYDPSFITAPIGSRGFKNLIRHFPEYEIVFFDISEVLYINKRHYPALAAQYGWKGLDPFELIGKGAEAIENRDALLQNLLPFLKIYPQCPLINQIAASIYLLQGQFGKALPHAEAVVQNFPETPMGYSLKGDALKGLKSYDEAISAYEEALKRTAEPDRPQVYKQIAYVCIEREQYGKAYRLLKKAIDPFSAETTYKDLFDLSLAALFSGKSREGIELLKFAYRKAPSGDRPFKERIRKQLSLLEILEED